MLIGSVIRHERLACYAGFTLLGIVACKELLVDTRTLTPGLRVVCPILVGGVFFAGSYLLVRFEQGRVESPRRQAL